MRRVCVVGSAARVPAECSAGRHAGATRGRREDRLETDRRRRHGSRHVPASRQVMRQTIDFRAGHVPVVYSSKGSAPQSGYFHKTSSSFDSIVHFLDCQQMLNKLKNISTNVLHIAGAWPRLQGCVTGDQQMMVALRPPWMKRRSTRWTLCVVIH